MTLSKGEANDIVEIIDLAESDGVSDSAEHWRRVSNAVPQITREEFDSLCRVREDARAIALRFAEQIWAANLDSEDPLPSAEGAELTHLRRFIQFFMLEHGKAPRDGNELSEWLAEEQSAGRIMIAPKRKH